MVHKPPELCDLILVGYSHWRGRKRSFFGKVGRSGSNFDGFHIVLGENNLLPKYGFGCLIKLAKQLLLSCR